MRSKWRGAATSSALALGATVFAACGGPSSNLADQATQLRQLNPAARLGGTTIVGTDDGRGTAAEAGATSRVLKLSIQGSSANTRQPTGGGRTMRRIPAVFLSRALEKVCFYVCDRLHRALSGVLAAAASKGCTVIYHQKQTGVN